MRLSPPPLCVLRLPQQGSGAAGAEWRSPHSASVVDQVRTFVIGFDGSKASTMSVRVHFPRLQWRHEAVCRMSPQPKF
jgi:hypothetical protein